MEKLKAPSPQPQTDSSPSLKAEAAKCAKILLGCYRTGDANDPDTYVRAVAAVLGEYPPEVMKQVCDPRMGLPAKSQWLPTIYELKEACEAAMRPIDRRRREQEAANQRRAMISGPTQPRPTYDELREKHGENWGLHPQGSRKTAWQPPSLDDLCKASGVSREDFDAINENAVKHLCASGT